MVTLFLADTTRVLAFIPPEDANSTWLLDLPSPPKKMHKTSHQRQIEHQNGQKRNVVYAQALAQATMLIAVKRTQAKKNCRPTPSVVVQVECKLQLCGFAVSLSSKTVNRYIRNDMAGSAPLSRGYKGIAPKAVFKLLVFMVESFIKIKQHTFWGDCLEASDGDSK